MKILKSVVVLVVFVLVASSFNEVNAQLTKIEQTSLIYMYEEEKLAHDVYFTLSQKYTVPIFKNIAKSEAYHMKRTCKKIIFSYTRE